MSLVIWKHLNGLQSKLCDFSVVDRPPFSSDLQLVIFINIPLAIFNSFFTDKTQWDFSSMTKYELSLKIFDTYTFTVFAFSLERCSKVSIGIDDIFLSKKNFKLIVHETKFFNCLTRGFFCIAHV